MSADLAASQPGAPARVAVRHIWGGWASDGRTFHVLDEQRAARPYGHWSLAADLNTSDADDVRRGTVIQKLWNAVDVRLKALHEDYRLDVLRRVLGIAKKSDTLEVLWQLGLVRPLIVRRLKQIRNTVEHQDRGAPSPDECANLVDSAWYFLRSTDPLAMERASTLELTSGRPVSSDPRRTQFVSFDFAADDWTCHVRGWFWPDDYEEVSDDHTLGLVLKLDEPPRYSELGAVYLSGPVDPASEILPQVVRDYFAADLPNGAAVEPVN